MGCYSLADSRRTSDDVDGRELRKTATAHVVDYLGAEEGVAGRLGSAPTARPWVVLGVVYCLRARLRLIRRAVCRPHPRRCCAPLDGQAMRDDREQPSVVPPRRTVRCRNRAVIGTFRYLRRALKSAARRKSGQYRCENCCFFS